ncbi:hypothetical protein L1887_39046 [Cichorium endivia]|nr:hypothetical protein L1887_39046 [Cichorium endivia]
MLSSDPPLLDVAAINTFVRLIEGSEVIDKIQKSETKQGCSEIRDSEVEYCTRYVDVDSPKSLVDFGVLADIIRVS